jgi:hypothetical protein
MNNFIIKCIEMYPTYNFHYKINLLWFSSFFTIDIPFHIEILKFFFKFVDQSHV